MPRRVSHNSLRKLLLSFAVGFVLSLLVCLRSRLLSRARACLPAASVYPLGTRSPRDSPSRTQPASGVIVSEHARSNFRFAFLAPSSPCMSLFPSLYLSISFYPLPAGCSTPLSSRSSATSSVSILSPWLNASAGARSSRSVVFALNCFS